MTTRSARLARGESTTGALVSVYTCPAGKTTIVKDIRIYAGVANSRAVVLVRGGGHAPSIVDQALTAVSVVSKDCWVILEPGDEIVVYSQSGTFVFWISGAELAGVAP